MIDLEKCFGHDWDEWDKDNNRSVTQCQACHITMEDYVEELEQQLADRDGFINDILSEEKNKWSQDKLSAHFDRIVRWRGVSVTPALQETDDAN